MISNFFFFFFKQKTAYEIRKGDWSSDVCSSDLLSALQKSDSPGAASSITKLSYTEFEKRYYETALEILGPYGQLMVAREEFEEVDTSSGEPGTFATAFLWSRAGTIYSGSSDIQKNIIGERVLGLPKEVRADRLKV